MARQRHKPEEIVMKLRQVEVLQSQGASASDAIRQSCVTEVTYYRWRKEYGGMKAEQLRRLKELLIRVFRAIFSSTWRSSSVVTIPAPTQVTIRSKKLDRRDQR